MEHLSSSVAVFDINLITIATNEIQSTGVTK
jgi:hypothetical protein